MFKTIIFRTINKVIRLSFVKNKPSESNIVYLTFDDGPEQGITEFVIDELAKYDFKATFFCRGDNAEKYPELFKRLVDEKHSIGNHTYSHLHAYESNANDYVADVERADEVLGQPKLFRPPHGSLTFSTWWKLRKRETIFWSLNSEDSNMEAFNFEHAFNNLKAKTKAGDIVLFHFCIRHEKETRQILPAYLSWLNEQGYKSKGLLEELKN